MNEISLENKAELFSRVQEQITLEVKGDVSALYEFTLPSISAKRIAERDDEPSLTKKDIKKFVESVHSAKVESIEIEHFYPKAAYYLNCPAAVVISKVRYNNSDSVSVFRTIWVRYGETWFSTALNKTHFKQS
jgi:hypothetical protein